MPHSVASVGLSLAKSARKLSQEASNKDGSRAVWCSELISAKSIFQYCSVHTQCAAWRFGLSSISRRLGSNQQIHPNSRRVLKITLWHQCNEIARIHRPPSPPRSA